MFHKIRRRLVMLNTIVFFIILCTFGVVLYFYMHQVLLSSIDERLTSISEKLERGDFREIVSEHDRDSERRVVYLFWDKQGNLIRSYPEEGLYPSEIVHLKPSDHKAKSRWNQSIGDQTYRVFKLDGKGEMIPPISATPIDKIELIYNIVPEINVLDHILTLIFGGSLVGIIVSLVAGFFLANRSLIPIQKSWDKQSRFVADASHELRTPLAVIQTHLELLFRHPDHTIEQESVTVYKSLQELKRVNKLVSDLLTLSRTDSNQQLINQKSFQLDELMDTVFHQFEPIADMKQISFSKEVEGDLQYVGDEEQLHQLFVILIDNAIKYTPEKGKIHIRGRREKNNLLLSVEDTGIGISLDDIPYIFDRFFRSDKSRTRSEGGTGLGLSIAKWIVEAHHGNLSVQSQLNEGTVMFIQLPERN
jgi:two-component system sensor histidine kinase CiaH